MPPFCELHILIGITITLVSVHKQNPINVKIIFYINCNFMTNLYYASS